MVDNITSSTRLTRGERYRKCLGRFIEKCVNDWSFDLASMVAYNLLISLLPIAVMLFGIVGFILKDPSQTKDLKDKIIHSFPSDNTTQSAIKQVVDLAFDQLSTNAGAILAIGIIFGMISSSRLFIAIDKSLTIIYRLSERTFLRQYLMSLTMLFLFIIVITLMVAASSVPSALMNTIPGDGGRFGVFLGGIVVSSSIAFVLFEMIYYFTPNKKMSLRKTWCGALVAAIILEIFLILFPLYVRLFLSNYAGQFGFAVILIFFFYYFATIVIIGAQINAHFFEEYQPLDNALGTYLSQMSKDHRHNNTIDSLNNNNDEQQLPIAVASDQHRKVGWINRLCSCEKRSSVEPQSEGNSDV